MTTKYTDQQMALILKNAAERQAAAGEATHSLESIQEIARQVGIDPQLVADAASNLDTRKGTSRVMGEHSAHRISRRLRSAPTSIDSAALLATIRDHLLMTGDIRQIGDGLEWRAGSSDDVIVIAVSPNTAGPAVRIDARHHGKKAVAYLGAGITGGIAVLLGAALGAGTGAAVGVAALGASFAGARAIWNRYARRRNERLRVLSDALVSQLESEGPSSES
jgi:transposase-like protein